MAARTALTVTALGRDGGTLFGAGVTPDAVNGNIIADPGAYKLMIVVLNADSSNHNLLIRARGYQGVPGGAANASYATGQYQPFAQASVGDLTVPCLHTGSGYTVVSGLTTDRFTQADGSLWLDWAASTSMTVYVGRRAYV